MRVERREDLRCMVVAGRCSALPLSLTQDKSVSFGLARGCGRGDTASSEFRPQEILPIFVHPLVRPPLLRKELGQLLLRGPGPRNKYVSRRAAPVELGQAPPWGRDTWPSPASVGCPLPDLYMYEDNLSHEKL